MLDTQIKKLIDQLNVLVPNSRAGLPQEVFYFVSRMTPLVNVDLLLKDPEGRTLLVWRKDQFYTGWHVPGGIIRFKEKFTDRIQAVAQNEFGCPVSFDPEPIAMNEKFAPDRDVRGHFISLLYRCHMEGKPSEKLQCKDPQNPDHGQWMWHVGCPTDLLQQHEVYRKYIES